MAGSVVVVTGAAGFIGSHVVDALLESGWTVRGIDAFTEYYSITAKRENLVDALSRPRFELHELNVVDAELIAPLLAGADVLIHLAAEPGVRPSWADGFQRYVNRNVLATQRLLEIARGAPGLKRIVVASSSSVYGDAQAFPTAEDAPTRPRSPYGITKLATEHLATAYATDWGLPTVSLRFFTVFGPRQRPDMAFHRLIEASLTQTPFPLFGTGDQVRDFTYVSDVVDAVQAASDADVKPGAVFNVAGGVAASLNEAIREVEALTGRSVPLDRQPVQAGDPERTGGDITAATTSLRWKPQVELRDGLREQITWHERRCRRGVVRGKVSLSTSNPGLMSVRTPQRMAGGSAPQSVRDEP